LVSEAQGQWPSECFLRLHVVIPGTVHLIDYVGVIPGTVHLIDYVVNRARLSELSPELPADFQSRVGSPEALYFKELPGRPCPVCITMHNDAPLFHAKFTHDLLDSAVLLTGCTPAGHLA